MKITLLKLVAIALFTSGVANVCAEEDILSAVEKACAAETEKYCSQVTMGEGRLLACYYAHEDKLSNECDNALYDGFSTFATEVIALNHVAEQCSEDIDSFCANTEAGDGRIAKCLGYHSEELSEHCSTAIDKYLEE